MTPREKKQERIGAQALDLRGGVERTAPMAEPVSRWGRVRGVAAGVLRWSKGQVGAAVLNVKNLRVVRRVMARVQRRDLPVVMVRDVAVILYQEARTGIRGEVRRFRERKLQALRRYAIVASVVVLVLQWSPIMNLLADVLNLRSSSAATVTATTEVEPNGDNTAQWVSLIGTTDSSCAGGTHCDFVDEGSASPDDATTAVSTGGTGGAGASGDIEEYDMIDPTYQSSSPKVVSVELFMRSMCFTCSNGGTADNVSMNLRIAGSLQTASTKTPTSSWAWYSNTFTAPSAGWTEADTDAMRTQFTWAVQGSGNPGNQRDDVRISTVYTKITYQYNASSKLTQESYIWENDDGNGAVDGNTQLAGKNTAITARKGQRLTARFHIKNTGDLNTNLGGNLGLFYDRNDGIWSKVESSKPVTTGDGSGCGGGSTLFDCALVQANSGASELIGEDNSMAIDPSGKPWISYHDLTDNDLWVANYVGSGGNCDTAGGGSDAWNCTLIDAQSQTGGLTSIAIDASGNPWVAYRETTSFGLWVANYVGSGGTCTTYSGSAAWNCTKVQEHSGGTENTGYEPSIAIDPTGKPWISYHDLTDGDLWVANYVGSGGNCDTVGGGSDLWDCTLAQANSGASEDVGDYSSIAFDHTATAHISHFDNTDDDLWVTSYVGSGGNCDTVGGGSDAWNCTLVHANNGGSESLGDYTSMAIDPSGNPWVSYHAITGNDLWVARYVGGTSGTGCGGGSTAWTCVRVQAYADSGGTQNIGDASSMAIDPSGNPWVTYYDFSDGDLWMARYVGSGGNCDDTYGGSDAWNCTLVQANSGASENIGRESSIAFDASGNAWLSYYNVTNGDLWFAKLHRGGEITVTPGLAGADGAALTESHGDMTSATDTTERDDTGTARCVSGTSVNWNDGIWSEAGEISGLNLPAGNSTAQCTEVAFTIDTSNASIGTTYRLVVATKDGWRSDRGAWRGPVAISYYATLTVVDGTPSLKFSKDNPLRLADCSLSTWGCAEIENSRAKGYVSLAYDPDGAPWMSYQYDVTGTNDFVLRVAKYKPGNAASGTCAADWECTTVDNPSNSVASGTSLAFDPSGNPWVAYAAATVSAVKIARYVGSGGTGCTSGSSAWSCSVVDDPANGLAEPAMAIDHAGNPWIAIKDNTAGAIKIARYVGTGGSGCTASGGSGTTPDWSCTVVDDPASTVVGGYNSMAVDGSGTIWISYADTTNNRVRVARYSPAGGSGCTASGGSGTTSDWTCWLVDDPTNQVGLYTSIAVGTSGNPWVSYYDVGAQALKVARYVGTGGSGCTNGSPDNTTWSCSTVDNPGASEASGYHTSAAIDAAGNPWVSFQYQPSAGTSYDLRVARYVGSGGSGCSPDDGSTTTSDWTCYTVDNDASAQFADTTSLTFDRLGTPVVAHRDLTNNRLRISKLHTPFAKPVAAVGLLNAGRSAIRSSGQYSLDVFGTGPCSSVSDMAGYCGVSAIDGVYDKMVARKNERPIYIATRTLASTSEFTSISWTGSTDVAPSSTNPIYLEIYKFGSTNGWSSTPLASINSGTCNPCTLSGFPTDTLSDYIESGTNNVYVRVWQEASTTGSINLKTDAFLANQTYDFLRPGRQFLNGMEQPIKL